MPKFAANISTMFKEVPLKDRIAKAHEAGFRGVECLFPYELNLEDLAAELDRFNMDMVLFNLPAGLWDRGDRGITSLPDRKAEFDRDMEMAMEWALELDCKRLHVMAGMIDARFSREEQLACYIENVAKLADDAARVGIEVMIEPISIRAMPGYFLNSIKQAEAMLEQIAQASVFIQLDLFHAQLIQGDLANTIERLFGKFAHVQIANAPLRCEPDFGEINYSYIFNLLDSLGYKGWIGCEYTPRSTTEQGLAWFEPYKGLQ